MPSLSLHPTCRWASQSLGMCVALGCLHAHTPHARPDAVTVQFDPAMSLGLNLDDFLGVSDVRYYVSWPCVTMSYCTRIGRIFWMHKVRSVPISGYVCR